MIWLVRLIGSLLVGLSFLLREPEEARVDTFLVRMWARVDDMVKKGASRHVALLHEISLFSTRAIQWTVGERLLSLRAMWTSAFTSFASFLFCLFLILNSGVGNTPSSLDRIRFLWLPLAILGAVAVGLLPRIHRHAAKVLCLAVGAWIVHIGIVLRGEEYGSLAITLFIVTVAGSVASDLVALAVLRAMLMRSSASRSFVAAVAFVPLSFLLALALAIGPLFATSLGIRVSGLGTHLHAFLDSHKGLWASVLVPFFVCSTNVFTACFALLYALVFVVAVVQKSVVPVIERMLYPLARHGLFGLRKTVFYIGTVLLLGPSVADIVARFIK